MISKALSDELHQSLLQEKSRLQREIEGLQVGINAGTYDNEGMDSVDQHPADEGTELFEREKNLAVQSTLARELDEVNIALQKFKDGTYGVCEICGKPIDERRLRAFPAATHDVECQAKIDRAQGQVHA